MLSFTDVRNESLPAWSVRGSERYYYDPPEDAVFFGDALDLPHAHPWRVSNHAVVPIKGWAHDDGCACRSCHRWPGPLPRDPAADLQ